MKEWKASMGRITMLPAGPASSNPLPVIEWYRRIWGSDPDGFQKQQNPFMPNLAHGKRGNIMASCSIHPTRIDFMLTPAIDPSPQVASVSLPLFEDAAPLTEELRKIAHLVGSTASAGQVLRVALTIQYLAPNSDYSEANVALMSVIPAPYGVRFTSEEDVIFQINRPYLSREVEGIKVNAVTKWSVDRFQIQTIVSGGAAATISSGALMPQTTNVIAASVVLDISSIAKDATLNPTQQSSLLREALASAARMQSEIGLKAKGDKDVRRSS
jgi:hypothetical protein